MKRTAIIAATLLAAAPVMAQTAPVEKYPPRAGTTAAPTKAEARVDINTATVEELSAVKGLTKVQAEAIIQARPFKSVDELAATNIVSADVFSVVRRRLTVTN
ncbi:ComEA family DNA-binding protein [Methylocystis suflitae]|uniref:ComEA family DNA-binding protein n=1 Tax=Methylocystis suflitae TaxID=2951405 RepID=UPI00210E8F5C|nr:helix-hairpin-helix domain-containing protein [Methylocystis suflitae]MCQ4190715.1 helix-hairpin-helix domain-containing protein [Methylocystis suflitae]